MLMMSGQPEQLPSLQPGGLMDNNTFLSSVLDRGVQSASDVGLDLWRRISDDGEAAAPAPAPAAAATTAAAAAGSGGVVEVGVIYVDSLPPPAAAALAVAAATAHGVGGNSSRRGTRQTGAASAAPDNPPPPPTSSNPLLLHVDVGLGVDGGNIAATLADLAKVESTKVHTDEEDDDADDVDDDDDNDDDDDDDDSSSSNGYTKEEQEMNPTVRKRHLRLKYRLDDPEEMMKVEKELFQISPALVDKATHRERDRKKYKDLTDPFKKKGKMTPKQKFVLNELRRKGQSCVYASNIRQKRKADTVAQDHNILALESTAEMLQRKCKSQDKELKKWRKANKELEELKATVIDKDKEIAELKAIVTKLSPRKRSRTT